MTDHGFLLGDGLFETLKVHNSKTVWLSEHYARLSNSAKFAEIKIPTETEIAKLCQLLVDKNEISNGYMRITVSRGSSENGRPSETAERPNIIITGGNLTTNSSDIKAGFASWPSNEQAPSIAHKTTSRFSLGITLRDAKKLGLDELVFINTNGFVTEGIVSNIFFVKDETLKTPAKECGLLPGIVRAKVLESAKELGIKTEEGKFTKDELLEADEVFFTNSGSLIKPCVELDGKRFRTDGDITETLKNKISSLLP